MRILHIITRLILGGAQQNTILSCAAQHAAGYDVHLAYGPIHGPEGSLLPEALASGATLHEIPSMVRAIHPLKDLRCHHQLRQRIHQLKPDIVHTHSSKAGILARSAAWKALRRHRSGTTARTNGTVIHTVHGLPWYDQQNPLVRNLYINLERTAATRCDHLIAITPAMADTFVQANITTANRFTIIPSGVDLTPYNQLNHTTARQQLRDQLGLPHNTTLVALVARLDPLKGHRDLIAAFTQIAAQHPSTHLVFIGDGFDRSAIEQAATASPAAPRIHFAGLIPLTDMPQVYAGLDIVALPSYQEGQSRVLVEALAAGCLTLAYDAGGIPDVLAPTGTTVPVADTNALAHELSNLIHLLNTPQAEARRAAGRQHAQTHYSAETMNQQLLDLYHQLRS
ncbi:glycosyltransferase family 4 protein [Mucisphaera sp.]|uniref:glycosyltransferase family 4 protein n=1 Tax=Mucisphaera sp. TaxID=2913024 RepID=UPI003D10F87B